MSKSGIHIKPENKGKFNATKKKTGKTTEELTHSKNPVTKKRAVFAQNARKWSHEDGGFLNIIGGPQEYSLGSWLGDNAGNLAQTIGGAALIATGVGVAPGAAMMASGAGGFAKTAIQNKIGDQEEELNNKKNLAAIGQNRLNQYNNQSYLPTFAVGGSMTDYGLGSYTPKDIFPPQNMYGYNLMAAGGRMPEGRATLKEAKEYLKLYPEEMKAGQEVEYEHTGNDKLALRIAADHTKDSIKMNNGNPPDYYKKLQESGISDELNKMPQVMAMGGKLSPEKAKEILRDGTIRNKPLTARQKRYFGFIAGGGLAKKQDGGYFGTTASIGEGLDTPTFNDKNLVTEYKGGGTHQENSLGGIPIGNKAKVEEGEIRVDFDEGSYIFSNKF